MNLELLRYVRLLRRWLWLLALCPMLAVFGAGVIVALAPPVYEAQVVVLVKPAQPLSTTQPGVIVTSEQVADTYARLMVQRPVLEQVVRDLHLKLTPDELAAHIKATPQVSTTIITVAVDSTSRPLARDVANNVVDDFITRTKAIQQQQVDQYTGLIRAQIDRLEQSITSGQSSVDQLSRPGGAPTMEQQTELITLQQQLLAERGQYSSLMGNLSDIEVQAARTSDNVLILSPAALPDHPVAPRPALDLSLALACGLTLAVAAVLVLERLDQTVKSDEQLAERTGLVTIGHIAFVPSTNPLREDLVVLADGQSQVAEAYRALRTNLLFSSLDKEVRTIVVTSSVPSEGKSRTAANLAIVLAQAGHPTVLVDADFRRPSQHRIFGRVRNVGLSNLVLRDRPEAELVWPVERVPDLSLIASGPTPPNPSELLGSAQLRSLLDALRQRYRYVVIDTPPVNAVTDPTVLAAHADATILVIEQGSTTYPAVQRATQALARVGANVVGAVINKLRSQTGAYYYYYYYHHYYQNGDEGNGHAPAHVGDPGGAIPSGRA